MNPIRIFVIDDQPVTIIGLRNMFRTDRDRISIGGNIRSVDQLIEKVQPNEVDIIMLEPNIAQEDPVIEIKKLRRHYISKPIIIFTSDKSPNTYQTMVIAGLNGYLLKTAKKEEIRLTIEKVMNGQFVFSFYFNEEDIPKTFRRSPKYLDRISPEEHKIMMLISHGHNQREIANQVCASVSGIEKKLKSLRTRYKAGNNVELFRLLNEGNVV